MLRMKSVGLTYIYEAEGWRNVVIVTLLRGMDDLTVEYYSVCEFHLLVCRR